MAFSLQKIEPAKQAIITLHEMLTYMRPHSTKTERVFVEKFVDDLPGVWADGYGNRHVIIGDPSVVWSCHTDSVHSSPGRQVVKKEAGMFYLKDGQTKTSSCLGADCATGVWLMRQMVLRQIPGHYIFHRDEECGGLGSGWIARNDPALLDGAQFAIAFDRKGYGSVITHQGGRTASDEFAQSLAEQLGGHYKPDSTGLFTDTAKYKSIIPECSNISVGYHDAHSSKEWQDYEFASELLEIVCTIDPTKLVVKRDPKVVDATEYYSSRYYGRGFSHWADHLSNANDWDDWGFDTPASTTKHYAAAKMDDDWGYDRPHGSTNYARLKSLISDYPSEIADWLDTEGVDADDLADALLGRFVR